MASPKARSHILSSYQFVTLVVACATFTDAFVYGMILPIIPELLRIRIGVDAENVPKWTSIVLATFGGFFLISPPVVGYLSDKSSSKKTPFMIGLVLLCAATLLLFTATSLPLLLVGRALQAVACSVCFTSGFSLLASCTPSGKKGAVMGFAYLGDSIGECAGPLLGGFIYTRAGHHAMFAAAVGIIAVDVVLRSLIRDEHVSEFSEVVTSVEEEQQHNRRENLTTSENQQSLEDRERQPLVTDGALMRVSTPTQDQNGSVSDLLSQPRLWASFWGMAMIAIIRNALGSTLTLFLAENFDWDASISGTIFFIFFSASFLAPFMGHVSEKNSPRTVSIFAFGPLAVSMTCLGLATSNTTFVKVTFVVLLFISGCCTAFALSAQNVAMSNIGADHEQSTLPYGTILSGWAAGILFGPLIGTALKLRFGWNGFCFSMAILSAITSIITLIWADTGTSQRNK